MNDEPSGREPIGEDARIDSLDARLKAAREREDERNRPKAAGQGKSDRLATKVFSDLLAGILGGGLIGWTIDRFADTSPWGLLVMLFLGIAVAFRNIIRISNRRPD